MINKNDDPRKAMKVPDGFFTKIEDEIMLEVSAKKVVPLWSRSINKISAIAAVFMAVIAITYVISLQNIEEQNSFASISEEVNWEYLLENYDDITYEDIAAFDESAEAILAFEDELYSDFATEDILEDVDLETIKNLYQ